VTDTLHHQLERNQGFLLRLARSLVADEHAALDVAQDTSVAFLSAPPRDAAAVRAWLSRVLRRRVGRDRRVALRREDREWEAARQDHVDGGIGRIDSALDAQSTLVQLVAALPMEQREAIVMRFFRERTPREIAEELEISVHTVNTRLRRALARLREDMDRCPGGRATWALALVPIQQPETAIVYTARVAAVGPWPWALVASIALALVVTILAKRPWQERNNAPGALATLGESVVVGPADLFAPSVDEPRRPIATALPESSGGDVVWPVELVLDGEGIEAKATQIVVTGRDGYNWEESFGYRTTIVAPGRSTFDLMALVDAYRARFGRDPWMHGIRIRIEHPDCVSSTTEARLGDGPVEVAGPHEPVRVSSTLLLASVVKGRIELPPGSDASHVAVASFRMDGEGPASDAATDTRIVATDGSFRLRSATDGRLAIVALAIGFRPATCVVTTTRGEVVDIGRIDLDPGHSLAGRVSWRGAPARGMGLEIGSTESREEWDVGFSLLDRLVRLQWIDGGFEHSLIHGSTDTNGRFSIAGLREAQVVPRPVSFEEFVVDRHSLAWPAVTVGTELELELAAAEVVVRLDFGARPPTGGRLTASLLDGRWVGAGFDARRSNSRHFLLPVDIDTTVRGELEGRPPFEESLHTPEEAGSVTTLTLTVPPPRATGTLRLALTVDGAPLADGTRVILELSAAGVERGHGELARNTLVVDGVALFEDLPVGAYAGRAYPGASQQWRTTLRVDAVFDFVVRADDVCAREQALAPGGNVLFEARAPEGRLVAMSWGTRILDASGQEVGRDFHTALAGVGYGGWTDRGPSSLMSNLLVGTYTLELRHPDYAPVDVPVEILAGQVCKQVFELRRR
jgi:RNA polymerase sigma factor (sigma-70 family)